MRQRPQLLFPKLAVRSATRPLPTVVAAAGPGPGAACSRQQGALRFREARDRRFQLSFLDLQSLDGLEVRL